MSIAFDLPKDKDLREDAFWQPYKLVSLRKMLDFYATAFLKALNLLAAMEAQIGILTKLGIHTVKLENFLDELPEYRALPPLCASAELMDAKRHAEQLIVYLDSGEKEFECSELKSLVHAVTWQLIYEVENRTTLMVPAYRTKYYKQAGTFVGQEAIDKISHIQEDAEEAGNCFALGRYSACVFHLGRLVEWCLRDFGGKTGIPFDDLSKLQWEGIINKIRSQLKQVWPSPKEPERIPYENMLERIGGMKDAWRAPNAHSKITFTGSQAEDVINSVKGFVRTYLDLLPQLDSFAALLKSASQSS